MTTAFVVKPDALSAWHALGGALAQLEDEGHTTPCSTDPEPFTSEDYRERQEAAEACSGCPALAPCQRFADANAEPAHVWGGTDRGPRSRSEHTNERNHR